MYESSLLKTLSTRENYDKFRGLVKEYVVLPEVHEIIEDIGAYFTSYHDDEVDWDKLVTWAGMTRHPHWTPTQRSTYETILASVASAPDDPNIIDRLVELRTAIDIRELADEAISHGGTSKLDEATTILSDYQAYKVAGGVDDPLAPYDLREIFDALHRKGGLKWRLEELNKSVGPICKGDLVLVAKRPEVGGTTFITSEITHMIQQMPEHGRAVLFNNEESKHKIMARLIQSGLNYTVMDMASDPDKTLDEWSLLLGTKRIDLVHDTALDTRTVEAVLKRHDYGLIAFNVLWKVKVKRKLEDYQKYEFLALWARQLADKHGPVIAVWQADASAEGMPWPNQSQLYGAKTAVQGEADVLIMIGCSHEPGKGYERYLNIVKNKTPGSDETDPALRHGQFTVDMDAERGRFKTRMTP